jgi:hypothetical protein
MRTAKVIIACISMAVAARTIAAPRIEDRDLIGLDTEFDFMPGASGSSADNVFTLGAECRRISLRATYGPGSWFVRFRGGAFFLPGDSFGLSAGLAIPIWELQGKEGQRFLGFDAFADASFPFVDPEGRWDGVDWSGGILFFLTPGPNGFALGARLSTAQGIIPFLAYTGSFMLGKK